MNAKIQQLMDRSFTDHQGEQFDPERFAELIVRECMQILANNGYDDAGRCLNNVYFGLGIDI